MPAIDCDYREPGFGKRVGDERTGDARSDDSHVAAAIVGQRRGHFTHSVAEEPECVR
jgi:hypothetical protein